ncbi:hypothetical protein [Agromyces laixinhei]|uniref:hypothetical protein n=1 Tax=Agromyces laixinhei TaxID=2585717 RepID=UPI00111675A1|nr:hypothetical protein [Agromyces laixinhei]
MNEPSSSTGATRAANPATARDRATRPSGFSVAAVLGGTLLGLAGTQRPRIPHRRPPRAEK